jgi:4-amino-4-deoxy-L-arabinose transferase-like glycosyltransferase
MKKKLQKLINALSPETRWLIIIILIASVLRGISWANTPMITLDGSFYIEQAKAIFYSQWDIIAKCGGLDRLSVYPFLIAAFYSIFSDWIIAGKAISFIFGVATIIPLYFLLRQFFDYKISALTTLIIAVNPFFVSTSVEILRDPIYWFFSVLGLYLFTVCIKKENQLFLLLSSISFLLAAWTRVEGILFFAVSFLYLLFQNRNIRSVLIFIFPAIVLFIGVILLAYFKDVSSDELHRGGDIFAWLTKLFSRYSMLSSELKELANEIDGTTQSTLKLFLSDARTNIWLIALGKLINKILETFFYLFLIPVIIGLWKIREMKKDSSISYFVMLTVLSFFILYFFVFVEWILQGRYTALFILSSIIFAGLGFYAIVKWFRNRFDFKENLVIIVLALVILLCTLPKNIQENRTDKLVYKEIGEFIVEQEGGDQGKINVSASVATQIWVSFYANINYKGSICHYPGGENCWEIFADDNSLISQLKKRNINYLLWTENTCSNKNINITKHKNNLRELGRWKHSNTGEMILFEVI